MKKLLIILLLASCHPSYDASNDESKDRCVYHNYHDGKNHCNRFNLIPINKYERNNS